VKTSAEKLGILAAVLSSLFGGMAAAVTRFAVHIADPVLLAIFRFGGGFLVLLPIALLARSAWPRGKDWLPVAALGAMFYGVFFVVYGEALTYTTAARGALAVSTLPILTMVTAALLGRERLSARKSLGVLIAMAGVAAALATGLGDAPKDAWRGDATMMAGMLSMALYNVLSRPLMMRSSPLGYATAGMAFGALVNIAFACASGGLAALHELRPAHWLAGAYLAIFAGGLGFYLWVYALKATTPTRVANTITVSPIAAATLATVLIGERIGLSLVLGIAAVAAGIWISSTVRSYAASRSVSG
jgi:drug/metabolite transporter (DMT)-like permease